MVLALAISIVWTTGLVVALVWLTIEGGWEFAFFAVCFLLAGLEATRRVRRPAENPGVEHDRVRQHLERLCLEAGWARPRVVIEAGDGSAG